MADDPDNLSASRNLALDGIRGAGALIVVLWHIAVIFFPQAAWGKPVPGAGAWEAVFYASPLWVLLSGSFAVNLFFVMSGYVLTIGFFRSGQFPPIARRAFGRIPRLAIPATASTLALYALIRLLPNWLESGEVPMLQANGAYTALAPYLNLHPDTSARALFDNVFVLPWLQPPDFKRIYNGVLWTMYVELLGSFLVMGLAVALGWIRPRWVAAGLIMCVAAYLPFSMPAGYGIYFAILLCGGAIAALDPPTWTPAGWLRAVPIALATFGLFLGGYNGAGLSRVLTPVVAMCSTNVIPGGVFIMGIGAILVFCVVLTSRDIAEFLSRPLFGFLGRISFTLYLFHNIVIAMAGVALFHILPAWLPVSVRSGMAAAASIAIAIGCAAVLARRLDEPAVRAAQSFGAWMLEQLRRPHISRGMAAVVACGRQRQP